jgi:membrane protein
MEASQVTAPISTAARVLSYAFQRFLADGALRVAASLSYSSLLALVPLFAISLAVLSAFEAFAGLREQLQEMLFDNLMPSAGSAAVEHFTSFVDNASRATGIGIIGLAATAVLLLNTITDGFNKIWRASEARPLVVRILIYWALLTIGPIFVGASFSLSTYAFAIVQWSGVENYTGSFVKLAAYLPFLLTTVAFMMAFYIVPNRPVRLAHALAGALVAGVLFELLKRGFGLYLKYFPSYEAIYGALAAVPIFLVWMYLSWAVVLLGAEIAASLPEWRAALSRDRHSRVPGAKMALALTILSRLKAASRDGTLLRETVLVQGLPATLEELDQVLRALRRADFVARSGRSRWLLSRDLGTTTLGTLVAALDLSMEAGEGWPDQVKAATTKLTEASAEPSQLKLADLLA